MSNERDIVVIGAGLTGLAAARALSDAGRDVLVIDKGRRLGGRLAHRARGDFGFDHGTPWVEADDPAFAAYAEAAVAAGAAAHIDRAPARITGLPDMPGLLAPLAEGIEIQHRIEVLSAERRDGVWRLETTTGHLLARHIVCTVPAPQARRLLPQIADQIARVSMRPGWTLMAAFEGPLGIEAPEWPDNGARVIRESAKPGRPDAPEAWTMHAPAEWSEANLERDREEIVPDLVTMLGRSMGRRLPKPIHARAHRWRYARTAAPLGRPFVAGDALHVGGDWCLGALAEHAHASGTAIAADMIRVRVADGGVAAG